MNEIMHIIGYPLGWVMWLAYKVIPIYPIALIFFTIVTRAAMLPMAIKQQKNSAHMALFKPKVDAIRKRYANNPQKAQQETQKLYEREGYNPFGGCSTMFIQLPVIYGLIDVVYRPMTHLLRLSGSLITQVQEIMTGAGWEASSARSMNIQLEMLHALPKYREQVVAGVGQSVYDKMSSLDLNLFGMDLGATPTWAWNLLLLIPIFSLITAMGSFYISMKMTQDASNTQSKGCMFGMVFGMPLLSAYFSFVVPAGVGFYWIISNIVACVQSIVLRKIITPEKVAAQMEKDRAAGKARKKSGFMSKMLQAQEAALAQGGASQEEETLSEEEKKALAEDRKRQELSDKEKLAQARRRYAEKYGDDFSE